MRPFDDESKVTRIGDLSFENQGDAVVVSGDVEITLDAAGLADARALRDLADAIVRRIEAEKDLPERIERTRPSETRFPNPFGIGS